MSSPEGAGAVSTLPQTAAPATEPHLFGWDTTPGVVAVEVLETEARLLRAEGETRTWESRPFRPWLVTGEEGRAAGRTLRTAEWTPLEGPGMSWLAQFPGWSAYLDARELFRAQGLAHFAYNHPVKQFLVRSGVTLFKGLEFGSVRRLQFDLETTTLQPADPSSRILLIAMRDHQGRQHVFSGDERRLIQEFAECFREADPDICEGHNLFNFDVPYLQARAEALGVPLTLGRNGSSLSFGRERNVPIGGIARPFRPANIWGRHLVDTLLAVQRFDVARGELESHGLKEVAIHYGLAAEDRVYLDGDLILDTWNEDPDRVREYAAQDVTETARLAELVLPTEFYQTQMVPDSYQNVATGGSGEKINSLLVREYLHRGHALPQSQPSVACPGGHTEIRETGILRHVVKADVESLYPSIMLRYGIRPQSDRLGVFLPMLEQLTKRRLEAKGKARKGGPERAYWDGLQASFKILINSFYGYLGVPTFLFNDFEAATGVTTKGQELIRKVADELEKSGSRLIEIDTDGVYFIPPPEVKTEAQEAAYVEHVGKQALPDGIRLAHDGRYAVMVSLKIKNYVLVDYEGRRIFKGASLRSRADELFGREFLARAMDTLIQGKLDALAAEYEELCEKISHGELPPEQFSRRERITEKTFESNAKKRSREVAQDLQVGDTMVVYQKADGSLGLIQDYAGDEDRWYYLDKLYKFASRLEGALGEEFHRIFPKPTRKKLQAEMAGQLSLF